MAMHIVGRTREQDELRRYCESGRPEFVVVYGRRRVGKTFLVREYFNGSFAFRATGIARGSARMQLKAFCKELVRYGYEGESPADWVDAFYALRDLLESGGAKRDAASGRLVVFLDELPWLAGARGDFLAALELFWNGWASGQPDVVLVVCGSATSWIAKNLFSNHGGLHNRVTGRIYLEPFTLCECVDYFVSHDLVLSRNEVLESYMVFGGVPYYYDQFDRRLSVAQNVDRLCFYAHGQLRNEFNELFASLYRHADRHVAVVRALARSERGLTRSDVERASGVSGGGTLSKTLEELELSGFIRKYTDFSKPKNEAVFQLVDPFTLFWLRFVEGTSNDHWWTENLQGARVRSWMGRAFELVCLLHVPQMLGALGTAGVSCSVCSWRSRRADPGAQIDLLIDRADGVINVCEMKYTHDLFAIDKSCDRALRHRCEAFLGETQTKKTLRVTLVTVYGVATGKYASVVQNVITAEDLFA